MKLKKKKQTVTTRLAAELTKDEQKVVTAIFLEVGSRGKIGDIYASIMRHGFNNPEKIKADFGVK